MLRIIICRLFSKLIVFSLLLNFVNCGVTTLKHIKLPHEERQMLKNFGIVCLFNPRVSFNLYESLDTGSDAYLDYAGMRPSLGYIFAKELSNLLVDLREHAEFEEREGDILTKTLEGWNFSQVFRNTLLKIMSDKTPYEIRDISELSQIQNIAENTGSFLNKNIDALIKIDFTQYGLESRKKGFAVYVYANIKIIKVATNNVIASMTIKYDYNYASHLHLENYAYIIRNLGGTPSIQYSTSLERVGQIASVKSDISISEPDSILRFPIVLDSYSNFEENNAQLLKGELKLAALQISREIISSIGLINNADDSWRNEYRLPVIDRNF